MTIFQRLFDSFVSKYIDEKKRGDKRRAQQIAELMIQLDAIEQANGDQFALIYQNWVEYRIAIEQLKIHNKQSGRAIDFVLETLERGAEAKYSDLEWLFFKNFPYAKNVWHTDFLRRCLRSLDSINVMQTANQNAGVQSEPETPQVQLV